MCVRKFSNPLENVEGKPKDVVHTLILVLWRQRQMDFCEFFESSPVYRASSKTVRAKQKTLVLKQNKTSC